MLVLHPGFGCGASFNGTARTTASRAVRGNERPLFLSMVHSYVVTPPFKSRAINPHIGLSTPVHAHLFHENFVRSFPLTEARLHSDVMVLLGQALERVHAAEIDAAASQRGKEMAL